MPQPPRPPILLAGAAGRALTAADPGEHRERTADLDFCLGPGLLDRAGDLVAEREGERAPLRHVEFLLAPEPEVAVLQMHVGMAHAAAADAHQHLAAFRHRRLRDGLAPRRRVSGQRLADHAGHWPIPLASATKPSTGISSARAVGSRPAFSSSGTGSRPSERRLWRSILRR